MAIGAQYIVSDALSLGHAGSIVASLGNSLYQAETGSVPKVRMHAL